MAAGHSTGMPAGAAERRRGPGHQHAAFESRIPCARLTFIGALLQPGAQSPWLPRSPDGLPWPDCECVWHDQHPQGPTLSPAISQHASAPAVLQAASKLAGMGDPAATALAEQLPEGLGADIDRCAALPTHGPAQGNARNPVHSLQARSGLCWPAKLLRNEAWQCAMWCMSGAAIRCPPPPWSGCLLAVSLHWRCRTHPSTRHPWTAAVPAAAQLGTGEHHARAGCPGGCACGPALP